MDKDLIFQSIPEFDFDLSKPASERWKHIFDAFSDEDIETLSNEGKKLLYPYISVLPMISSAIDILADKVMFREELVYIANRIGMKFSEVVLLQLVYEANSMCTSAIFNIKDKKYFFRTMDWNMPFLKKYTIQLNVKRDGKKITEAITWLGQVGYFTATSLIHFYSIAVNYRRTDNGTSIKNMMRTVKGYYPVAYLVRMVTNAYNISDCIKALKESELISPCYFIVCTWKIHKYIEHSDCIITRDCDSVVDVKYKTYIRDDNIGVNKYIDYEPLIQTNCDWNKTDPNILYSLERAKLFKELSKNTDGNLNDLLKFPILNKETIYVYYRCNNITLNCIA